MRSESTKLRPVLFLLSLLIAVVVALPARGQEPVSCPAPGCGPGSHIGEKSTVFRFRNLRAGAIKTDKGWNVQDFASSFFNPNSVQITVTMTLVSDDPKFVFNNGQIGTFTKTFVLPPMFGITDNIYIGYLEGNIGGTADNGKPNQPVANGTNFTGSVEFFSSEPFYYYMLPVTGIGEGPDPERAYFNAWDPMVEPVPVGWDHDLKQFVVPYTNYWHHEKHWPLGWYSNLSICNMGDHSVTYTLRHIPFYGAQFNPKNNQVTHYQEQVVQLAVRPHQSITTTLPRLYGWAADQMSAMEGALLINPDRSDAQTETVIYFSVVPNNSGERMHDYIL
jgi:hypothetical protein